MRFLADECFSRRVADGLVAQGHNVSFAISGSSDETVLAAAHDQEAALLTEDTDFGELAVRQRRPHHGILLLRMAGASTQEKLAAVTAALPDLQVGKFVVVKGSKVRAR